MCIGVVTIFMVIPNHKIINQSKIIGDKLVVTKDTLGRIFQREVYQLIICVENLQTEPHGQLFLDFKPNSHIAENGFFMSVYKNCTIKWLDFRFKCSVIRWTINHSKNCLNFCLFSSQSYRGRCNILKLLMIHYIQQQFVINGLKHNAA